jgi:hypothetical protein
VQTPFYFEEIFSVCFLFIYYRTGRATTVRIKDDTNSQDIRTYTKSKVQLTKKPIPKVSIKLPPDNEVLISYNEILFLSLFLQIAYEFQLDNCTYMEDSSVSGSVASIHIDSEQQTVIILGPDDECVQLLDYIENYSKSKSIFT